MISSACIQSNPFTQGQEADHEKKTTKRSIFSRTLYIILFAVLLFPWIPHAFAGLERVGPVNQANGFPGWYQDTTGLVLEFCQVENQVELDGGWCLLLPGDTTSPETFPSSFADEHFYWAGNARIDFILPNGTRSRALLVLGLEGAFAQGPVVPGDQIVFGRIRIRINDLPYSGTYTVRHPFGTRVFPDQVAGSRLFFTEDIGFNCQQGQFDCALVSHLGPFLLPSDVPGGIESPAVTGPAGKLYIADPARLGPVTGSPAGQNFFSVEGPNGFILQTNDFNLMGRIFTGTIPGRVTLDRASYTQAPAVQKLDVFSTAFPTTQGRIPPNATPPAITPLLSFFNAPCDVDPVTGALTAPAGQLDVQMFNDNRYYWGQSQPNPIPSGVCVQDETARDATGQLVPAFYQAAVTDEVTVTEAAWDPASLLLSVKAASSDATNPPTLTLNGHGPMTAGAISVSPLLAPPAKVHVVSSAGGVGELRVTTGLGSPGGNVPLALNDEISMNEDQGTLIINVLANDTFTGTPTVAITGAPRLGTALVNADGTISYTPFANANGMEGIAYTVTAGGATSSPAYIEITINPVNDLPIAVNDALATAPGTTSLNLLANDIDADGQADLSTVVIVTPPQGATVTPSVNGSVSFTASNSGTYIFTYRAVDRSGARSSLPATVTVTVTQETITVQQALFRTTARRWIVSGTDSVRAGQTLTITYDNGPAGVPGTVIGTAVVDATGAWVLDIRGVSGVLDPTLLNPRPNRIRITSSLGRSVTATFTIRN